MMWFLERPRNDKCGEQPACSAAARQNCATAASVLLYPPALRGRVISVPTMSKCVTTFFIYVNTDCAMKESKLEKFKKLLDSKAGQIFANEMSHVASHRPNLENIKEYLRLQKETFPLAHKVLEPLLNSIQHVSKDMMQSHIVSKSMQLSEGLQEQEDTRFYIALSGHSAMCRQKSNMWLAVLFLNIDPDLLDNFVDFLCYGKPLHGELDTSMGNIVYIDDGTFTAGLRLWSQ